MSRIKQKTIIRGSFFLLSRIGCYFVRKGRFAQCGDNVIITPPFFVGNTHNLYIGPNVSIGPKAHISANNAKFVCKGYTAIAENLTVHTGNHARIIGQYVTDIKEADKPQGYDKDVIVCEDVWIGSNVTLLAGVTIGRGATVAAGAVVAKSMPPYCICGGIPAKFIKFYWTIDEILAHEAKLYPEEERYKKEQLDRIFAEWGMK